MQNASTSSYPNISSYKNIDFKALWTYLESDHCHVFSWLGCYNPLIVCRADSLTDSCNKCICENVHKSVSVIKIQRKHMEFGLFN